MMSKFLSESVAVKHVGVSECCESNKTRNRRLHVSSWCRVCFREKQSTDLKPYAHV